MKKISKIMMMMFAVASIGLFASCEKVDDADDGYGPITGNIVGKWNLKTAYLDNNVVTADNLSFTLKFNSNGTGNVLDYGFPLPAEEATFTWSYSAENNHTLTITLYNGDVLTYTVIKLTNKDFNIAGTVVPFVNLTGDVKLFMTRVGSSNPGGDDEEEADFPGNTNWRNTYNTTVNVEGHNLNLTINSLLKFNRTGNGGSLTASTSVEGVPVSYGINFTYTFNAEANTGILTFSAQGAEDVDVPFVYNPSDPNTISFSSEGLTIPEEYASYITLPETMVFTRMN